LSVPEPPLDDELLELDEPAEPVEPLPELELLLEPQAATPSDAASASTIAVMRLVVNVVSFT
jgi:hypothetical protein